MFRTCELLMYGGLLSTGLWLSSQSFAQDSFPKASDPFSGASRQGIQTVAEAEASTTPEDVNRRRVHDHLRQARIKLEQGQRDEALRLTARAASMAQQWKLKFAPHELSPQKLISEIQATEPLPIAGQAPAGMPAAAPGGVTPVAGKSVDREQVQAALAEARQQIIDGNFESARRTIELVRTVEVEYSAYDLRPEQLLAEIARRQPARPEGPSEALQALTSASESTMPQVRPQAGVPAAEQKSPKAEAIELMAAAKQSMSKGHFSEARELALEAQRKDVAWGLLDETPEHLLAELERQTKKQVIAAAPAAGTATQDAQQTRAAALDLLKQARAALENGQPDLAQQKAADAQNLNASYALFDDRPDLIMQEIRMVQAKNAMQPGAAPAAAAAPTSLASQDQKKQQATAFLSQAREAMRKGDTETAQRLIDQAETIDVAFGLFEDQPAVAREDLNRLIAAKSTRPLPPAMERAVGQESLAQNREMPSQDFAAREAQTRETQSREGLKAQSTKLLLSAREDLKAGRIDQAREKATRAATFDVTYDLFEDSPERLLSEVEAISARPTIAAGMPQQAPAAPAGRDSQDGLKQEARALIAAARADLQAGRVEDARQKAAQAATFDVAYDLFEDSPERILADATRPSRTVAAAPASRGMEQNVEHAQSLFDSAPAVDPGARGLDLTNPGKPAATALAARDSMVVPSSGMSAQEMFDQGVSHLRNGDREGAYEFFLQAYHSGEKLDNYRQQQLQDKLRELSPRRKNIERVSNEVASTERLDAVADMRSQQFDKVRTECLNAIFRAEKLRDKQPEQAVQLLNKTLESIDSADLSPEQAASLSTWVKSSRSSIETYLAQQAPVIELERRNSETKDLIEREIQTRVRVEQELADLVQKFNELYSQKRYAEANAVAKQAAALNSENPTVVTMTLKSEFAMANDRNAKLRAGKAESFYEQLQAVEESAINPVARDDMPLAYAENWEEIKKKRQKLPADAREHTEAEMRVRRSLSQPVSLHFNNAPLSEVLKYIADTQGINVSVDEPGLTEEAVTTSTPISINVDGIQLKSALNLILDPLNLGYTIQNEVLNITSRMRRNGDLEARVYQVADLVVPVSMNPPVSRLSPGSGYAGDNPNIQIPKGLHGVSATPNGQNGFAQVGASPHGGITSSLDSMTGAALPQLQGPGASNLGFKALTDLITTTVAPQSWHELGGTGSVNQHDSTMSLVIRQTQAVHQEVADLLDQLRRLQDLQVTIEVRFITVSDQFFEQIGIDFDFNINDTIGNSGVNNDFSPMRPFGSTDPIFGGTGGSSGGGAGTGGGSSGSSGSATALAPFGQGPTLNMQDHDNWPSRTVVGLLNNTQTFSPTLDVPFRQGSFDLAAPTFGGFDPNAGISFGMAILSDIEAFMFVRAAQGDRRSNVMFAPKITLFNGQMGSVTSMTMRPFVMSLTPVASAFNIGYQPEIAVIGDGTSLSVQAVVSADRRYVRLSVLPLFQNVTDVFTFSYLSAGGGAGGGTGGGIGGGIGGGGTGGGIGGGGTGGGGGNNNNNSAAGTVTVQQPVVTMVSVSTVVSVPDGGTVLLGGVKSLREGRNMAGVPILNKIPYISRLFKNTGVGRETTSLMMMVTPRIIIQEEQEQMLGIPN